jgi:acyl carrier protein
MREPDMGIRERIVGLIEGEMASFDPAYSLSEQLDSLQLFSLVLLIEEEFEIHFVPIELRTENVADLDKITQLVASKLK